MKVTTERLENCQVRVTVELDAAEAEDRLRQTAREVARKYPVPGYRKGKAPYHAVLRIFGRSALQEQALDTHGQELYDEALKQIEYEPYEGGRLEKVDWDPFRMEILLPIRPEIDLGDYRSIRLEPEPEAVTDEDVDRYLEELRQQHAQWVPVERPAQFGDRAVLDIEGKIGERTVLGNEGRELILTEDAAFPVPGFHAQIVGMRPGEEKSFPLSYPDDDLRPGYAGQEAMFHVRLVALNEQDIPALDDDLALMVGDYESLEDLRASVRKRLEDEARQRSESQFSERVLTQVIEAAPKIEYPPQAVDKEIDDMLDQMQGNLGGRGLQLDTYLSMIGKTRQSYRQELRPVAEGRVRRLLAMSEIIRREQLRVEPEEIDAELERLRASEEFQDPEMQSMLDSPTGRLSVLNNLLLDKANQRLTEIAAGKAPPLPEAPAATEPEPAAEVEAAAGEPEPAVEAIPAGAEGEPAARVETSAGEEDGVPEAGEPGAPTLAEAASGESA